MKAVQYVELGKPPEVVDIDEPVAPPGGMVIKVLASGLCHSDEFVMSLDEKSFEAYGYKLPMTLGHETAGEIVELGEGTSGVKIGDRVLVWGCGVCDMCARGNENYCRRGMVSPGFALPGGMAEYMPVDSVQHVVPIGGLDPVKIDAAQRCGPDAVLGDQAEPAPTARRFDCRRDRCRWPGPRGHPVAAPYVGRPGHRARHRRAEARLRP